MGAGASGVATGADGEDGLDKLRVSQNLVKVRAAANAAIISARMRSVVSVGGHRPNGSIAEESEMDGRIAPAPSPSIGPPDHSKCPFNSRQATMFIKVWRDITQNDTTMKSIGFTTFTKMFETEKTTRGLFGHLVGSDGKFRSTDHEQRMVAHGHMVMFALDELFSTITDLETFTVTMDQTAARHLYIDNFQPRYIKLMQHPLLEAIEASLGKKEWTPTVAGLFNTAFLFIVDQFMVSCRRVVRQARSVGHSRSVRGGPRLVGAVVPRSVPRQRPSVIRVVRHRLPDASV